MRINYLDLFSGIGGFSEGIRQAGIEFAWHGFSEIDKYASSVYKKHFPAAVELGTITALDGRKIPKCNLITFGFPCQDLSIAGKRKGLEGHRSGLFFEAMRIIDENKPDYFIFENVKGLLSSNDGKDFEIVLRTIADYGYDGQWQLLNTSWFLPQNRERIYFVGYPRTASRPEIFPIGEGDCGANGKERGGREGILDDIRNFGTIASRDYKGGNNLLCIPEATKQGYAVAKEGDSINLSQPNSETRRGGVGKGVAQTIDTQMEQYTLKGKSIRRLTPTECERLQGFPDNWTKYGHDGKQISDSQRYKMLGNAVSVPVVKIVITKLFSNRG